MNITQKKIVYIVLFFSIMLGGYWFFYSSKNQADIDDTNNELSQKPVDIDITSTSMGGLVVSTTIEETIGTVVSSTKEGISKTPVQEVEQTTEKEVVVPSNPFLDANNVQKENKKEALLGSLEKSIEDENYTDFAIHLATAYENTWNVQNEFTELESKAYVQVTKKYFDTGDIDTALDISTTVYKQVSTGWRFRYLRIRSLEQKGREAFDVGDLDIAETYALDILGMEFRIEGADLLGDIYIKKIENAINENDKQKATSYIGSIWDYEVSADRRDTLTALQEKIQKMK